MNRQRKFAMILAIVLAVLLILPFILSFIPAGAASSSKELDRLKKNAAALKSEKTRLVSELASVRTDRQGAIKEKAAIDQQIAVIEQETENTTLLIAELSAEIARRQTELDAAQQEEQEQTELYRTRIRVMEETSDASYLGILLGADSFSDLLGRMDMISEIMQYEQDILNDLKKIQQGIADTKASLEEDKNEQQQNKRELAAQQAELVVQYEAANQFIKDLEKEEIEYKKAYEAYEKAEKEAQAEIAKEMARIAAEAAKQNRNVPFVGGNYIWPVPGYKAGSPYGMRVHPILKTQKMHTGQDIPAPTGTSILASNSGTVIIAKYSSGYGNYVVIDHGGGQATLYAHQSKILVKVGQEVKQGAVIGKVGSTGLSTGPHLHFEVIINGAQKNPMSYVRAS